MAEHREGLQESKPDLCAACGDWLRDHPDGYQECSQCGVRSPEQVVERRTCIVCAGPMVFLDETTCSDRCDRILDTWPEP